MKYTIEGMNKMPRQWWYISNDIKTADMPILIGGYFNDKTNYYRWGVHNNIIRIGGFLLYFNYNLPIAFKDNDGKLYITRNENKDTGMGRALNSLSRDKSIRISWNNFYNILMKRFKSPIL